MLRTILCCVLILAAAAVAQPIYSWVPLEPTPSTPNCPVGQGSLITYGADSIWGIFPNANDGKTYVSRYGPLSTHQQIPPAGHWLYTVPIPFGPTPCISLGSRSSGSKVARCT